MKKTLALALVLVMVISSVCVIFASAEVPEAESTFFVVAFDDGTKEGAGAIFTEKDAGGAWWIHVSFKPVEGAANTYEVVDISDGIEGGGAVALDIPEGGFVYGVNTGNNYPALLEKDPSKTEYEGKPNYTSTACNDMIAQARKWAKGDQITIKGVDIANKTVPTNTPDKEWYEDGYTCTATYVKYDPNAQTEEPEEPSEPEKVTVEEKITVDGKLDDTGWTKAEWKTADSKTCKAQNGGIPDTFKFEYAVRADDNNVYVAVKVNAPANNVDNTKKPTVESTASDFGTQFDAYRMSGSAFRIYLEANLETKKFDKLIDILVVDGKPLCLLGKVETTAYTAALTTTDTESFYEIQLKKSDLGIGDTFKMAVSYSDKIFGENNDAYDVLNDHSYDGGDAKDEPWNADTHYTEYTVADLKLGTYEEEVKKPDLAEELKALEEELKGKVTEVADADFKVALTSKLEKNDAGKLIYTVTLTLKDLKADTKVVGLSGKLHYDPEVLSLTNKTVVDEEGDRALDVVVHTPGTTWENLCALVNGEDGKPVGEVDIQLATRNANHYVKDDAPLELQFVFEVLTDAKVVGVYVDSEGLQSTYMPPATETFVPDEDDVVNYKIEGAYTADAYAEPAEPSESSNSTSSTPSKPGDAGILIFAVLGIVAIAGAVTVIKVRR